MRKVTKVGVATVGIAAALSLSGCKASEWNHDSPVDRRDSSPAVVLEMPDGFSNVARKCDGPNMVYVVFHNDGAYGSVSTVANDPRCSG